MYLPGIVLKGAREERLCKEETTDPEARRCAIVYPLLHEFQSFHQIVDPASQWLEAWVAYLMPDIGHLVIEQAVEHYFQVLTHHHESVNGLININE